MRGSPPSAKLRGFLAEYGHRETVSPLLVSAADLGEAPATVLGLVAVLASEPPRPAGADRGRGRGTASARRTGSSAAAPVRDRMRRLRRRPRARGSRCGRTRHFYLTRYCRSCAGSLLEVGRRLVGAGVLREPEEVFHLRLEELEAALEPDRLPPEEPTAARAGPAARGPARRARRRAA